MFANFFVENAVLKLNIHKKKLNIHKKCRKMMNFDEKNEKFGDKNHGEKKNQQVSLSKISTFMRNPADLGPINLFGKSVNF